MTSEVIATSWNTAPVACEYSQFLRNVSQSAGTAVQLFVATFAG